MTAEGSREGARYLVQGHTTKTVLNEKYRKSARLLPLESPHLAEGARDQSSSARRGLPSKGEPRALHHQPRPSIDLDQNDKRRKRRKWKKDVNAQNEKHDKDRDTRGGGVSGVRGSWKTRGSWRRDAGQFQSLSIVSLICTS